MGAQWTLLPGNIMFAWGSQTITSSGDQTYNWVSIWGIPAFTGILSVQITGSNADTTKTVKLKSFSNTQLTVNASASSSNFQFLAIGLVDSTLL